MKIRAQADTNMTAGMFSTPIKNKKKYKKNWPRSCHRSEHGADKIKAPKEEEPQTGAGTNTGTSPSL